jgi:seryl-tRNA synthetase
MRRCREFGVREVVCVGTQGDVARFRSSLLDLAAALLDDLCLGGRIATACDPFFTDAYAGGRGYQLSFAVKHEIQAAIPHDGSALAVGSVNLHGDHFGTTWAIGTPGGTAHSCCLGLGLDRWCYALVAQHGADLAAWPRRLRDALGAVP